MDQIVQASDRSMQMATSIATAVEQQAAQELAQLGAELNKAISWFEVDKNQT